MQAANRLQLALKAGKPTFGAWQMLPGPNLSRALARTPGLDWICVDCEHGNVSDAAMHESVAAIAACGVSPVVRVAEGQHWMIKRALDAGAHGIVVPLLRSGGDAAAVVRAAKFSPLGTRGLGSPFAMEKFAVVPAEGATVRHQDVGLPQYFREANGATLVIVQIETVEALGDIEAIAGTLGVDVCFVGPFDLANSIGFPVGEDGKFAPEVNAAITKIRETAKKMGKWTAIYASSGEEARKYVDAGFDMASVMNDYQAVRMMFGAASAAANKTT